MAPGRLLSGWAGLGRFWLILLLLAAAAGGVLQWFGPPAPHRPVLADNGAAPPPADHPTTDAGHSAGARPADKAASDHDKPGPDRPKQDGPNQDRLNPASAKGAASGSAADGNAPDSATAGGPAAAKPAPGPAERVATALPPGRATPGPIADPDPALQEPNPPPGTGMLPRISLDGREPMREYAAGFDRSSRRPRVGLVVGGIGMNTADSLAAVRQLPTGVTLAVSPYAQDPGRVLSAARMAQLEYLLEIPMEPQGFPTADPDDRKALMTSLSQAENSDRLHAVMARFGGYVGATNAFGPMRGERLAGVGYQFEAVLKDLAARGLLFVDARPGADPLPYVWNRPAAIVIDEEPLDADAVDQRLAALSKLAQDKGSALGLVMLPRPMTLDRIAAWANGLTAKGLILAPASALALPPAKPNGDSEK